MAVRTRSQLITVLLVGEGHAEEAWLRHLKALYVARGNGVAVTIKNARGKGAQHVIDYAIGQTRNAAYDYKLALLDADTDWTEKVRKKARQADIDVIACMPCLEALLLQTCGAQVRPGLTSAQLKHQFQARFGAPADEPRVYAEHFQQDVLARARTTMTELHRLLRVFTVQALPLGSPSPPEGGRGQG